MRVTAKGQVTIPQELRDRFDLGPGTEVEIIATDEGALVRSSTAGPNAGRRLVDQLRGRADAGMSADAVLRLTRGDRG